MAAEHLGGKSTWMAGFLWNLFGGQCGGGGGVGNRGF